MNHQVQSALDAAKRGESDRALKILQQVLAAYPNDVDAWLAMAMIVEQPEQKRQYLHRVLSLDPTNQSARNKLLDMDRAAMGDAREQKRSFSEPPITPVEEAFQELEDSVRDQLPPDYVRPLIFLSSPSSWFVTLYLFSMIFCCAAVLALSEAISSSSRDFLIALVLGFIALAVTSVIKVDESGIRLSRILSRVSMEWHEIARIQVNPAKGILKFFSIEERSLQVSAEKKHYSDLIQRIRRKRPDLFEDSMLATVEENSSTATYEPLPSDSMPAFTGTKTFGKSFFRQYGLTFVGIFYCLIFLFIFLSVDMGWDLINIAVVLLISAGGVFLIFAPFFQVAVIQVEPNKLTLETLFEKKELSGRQIREIKMVQVHGKYGIVRNVVQVFSEGGKSYALAGFTKDEEFLYSFLINWWNTYRDK